VLIKKEEDCYLAHCLELDLVTTAPTIEQVREDIAEPKPAKPLNCTVSKRPLTVRELLQRLEP
jgi:hypothetical protein